MARLPPLETRERGLLAWRVGDDDERHLRARRRHPRRLPLHLAEVRGPRSVAEAGRLVARGELEERLERADGLVHRGVRIADRREALRDALHREVYRLAPGYLLPRQRPPPPPPRPPPA